jgi:hypothetical protein
MSLIIERVVGYMLKVLKSQKKITAYKKEFNAIRHGDYKSFLSLIGGKVPFMITYNNGDIYTEENNPNYDCDFEGLFKSGESLKIFFNNCYSLYGKITDEDIPDAIYQKAVLFEIALRMHANNFNLLSKTKRIDLIDVINILCDYKSISNFEKEKLQKGRIFLNMIKHFKNQYPSWHEGIKHFLEGYSVLEKYKILVV